MTTIEGTANPVSLYDRYPLLPQRRSTVEAAAAHAYIESRQPWGRALSTGRPGFRRHALCGEGIGRLAWALWQCREEQARLGRILRGPRG